MPEFSVRVRQLPGRHRETRVRVSAWLHRSADLVSFSLLLKCEANFVAEPLEGIPSVLFKFGDKPSTRSFFTCRY